MGEYLQTPNLHFPLLKKKKVDEKLTKSTFATLLNFWLDSFFFSSKKIKIEVEVQKKDQKKKKESANTGS